MGTLRTTEQLNSLFQQFKENREKKLQKEKQRKLQLLKEKYKLQQKEKKEALQALKIQTMDYLSTLAPKRSNSSDLPVKIRRFTIYHSNTVEREPKEEELYQTRKELKEWERENHKCINWQNWEKAVKQCQQRLKELGLT